MTDEQIVIELARLKGYKIAPINMNERVDFFGGPNNQENYPCFDPLSMEVKRLSGRPLPWNPLTDWAAAIALAEKWAESRKAVIQMTRFVNSEWRCRIYEGQSSHFVDSESGPRAVSLAVALAAGIEVEG